MKTFKTKISEKISSWKWNGLLIAIPPPLMHHIDATKEFVSINKGTFFLVILICFGLGWIYAKRTEKN